VSAHGDTVAPGTAADAAPAGRFHLLRRIELIVLIAIGALLLAAVIDDVVRQVGIDDRVLIDKRTYSRYFPTAVSKHIFVNPGKRSTLDVACAHLPGAPDRGCLMLAGPSRALPRQVLGSYRLPRKHPDKHRFRYSCTGLAVRRALCPPGARPR